MKQTSELLKLHSSSESTWLNFVNSCPCLVVMVVIMLTVYPTYNTCSNFTSSDELDLHGLHVDEAITALEEKLTSCKG